MGVQFADLKIITVAQWRIDMRTFDVSPLYRSTVGFDRLFKLLDGMATTDTPGSTYPPYNIERTERRNIGENKIRKQRDPMRKKKKKRVKKAEGNEKKGKKRETRKIK